MVLPGRIMRSISGTIESAGIVRPIDTTEVLTLKDTERNVEIDSDFFIPGRPQSVIQGTVLALEGGLAFRYSGKVPTGDDPESIRAADLNGDGNVDLVSGDDGGVSFLPGDGKGGFPSRLLLPGGDGSNEDAMPVDVDGDGVLDLAVASTAKPAKSLLICKGLGKGRFAQPTAFEVGDFPEAIEAADFDGDGNIDLALAIEAGGDARILFGDGKGTFPGTLDLPVGGRSECLVAVDLNGDGLPDLLIVDQKELTVFINAGGRKFAAGAEYDAGPQPLCIAAADFDGDGFLDAIVGNGGLFTDICEKGFALLRGKGDGSFEPASFIPSEGGIAGVAVGDFDGDGDADVAGASSDSHECAILLNDGGTLKPAGALPCGWSPAAVTTADFNGDGLLDIAVANECSDDVSIWFGAKVE
jgi:hypothetical protein